MKYIRSNYRRIKWLIIFGLLGLIIGAFLFYVTDNSIKENIYNILINNSMSYDYILFHLGLFSFLGILGFIYIGVPFSLFYYFYECLSIGYLVLAISIYYSFKGIIYSILYIIFFKGIFMASLAYFIINMVSYTKKKIMFFKMPLNNEYLSNYLYRCIFTLGLLLVNDLVILFIGNNVFELLNNILK